MKKKSIFSRNEIRYYKTGDIVFADKQGDMLFTGRKDQQIKIQGYRVELSEIEHYVREELHIDHIACVAKNNNNGTTELHLFIEVNN
jgi:acyl-coenzyme A synthetase/AMP-(fatty) acid ligase